MSVFNNIWAGGGSGGGSTDIPFTRIDDNGYALGDDAGGSNTGLDLNAFGYQAGENNNKEYLSVFGFRAGQNNTGAYSCFMGYDAGQENTGSNAVGIGKQASKNNSGIYAVGIGSYAMQNNSGDNSVGIGYYAAEDNSEYGCVFIGRYAGQNNDQPKATGIGDYAGRNNAYTYATAIGAEAEAIKANQVFLGHDGLLEVASYGDWTAYKDSTSQIREVSRLKSAFIVDTDASRTARMSVFVSDYAADREALRIDTDGSGVDMFLGDVSGGNTTEIEADGTLTFNGDATVWDDQQVTLGAVGFGSSAPTWEAYKGGEVLAFANNQSNNITFNLQYSHKIKTGTTTEFHLHTVAPDNNAGAVRWQLTVSYASINGAFPAETTILATQTIAANSQDDHIVFEITDAFAASVGISGVAICGLTRLGSDGADTYANDIYLVALDSHFEIDTVGSRQEYTK